MMFFLELTFDSIDWFFQYLCDSNTLINVIDSVEIRDLYQPDLGIAGFLDRESNYKYKLRPDSSLLVTPISVVFVKKIWEIN